jgi:hypothetical protein
VRVGDAGTTLQTAARPTDDILSPGSRTPGPELDRNRRSYWLQSEIHESTNRRKHNDKNAREVASVVAAAWSGTQQRGLEWTLVTTS